MKKTRLLSMLLAIALVFTSLPLMATAVAADDAAMAKGDKIAIPNTPDNWTGVADFDDSFASAWIRDGGYNTFMVQLYKPGDSTNLVAAGTQYTAKIAVRTPDATFAASKPAANVNSAATVNYMIHSQGWGSGYLGISYINAASLTATPTEYPINFTVPTGTDKTWHLRLHTNGGDGSKYAPLGISGIIVYETANESNVVYSWGKYSNGNWATIASHGQTYHEIEYLGADVTAATSATYDIADTKLLPGVYQLTGTFSTDADSVVLTAKANDVAMVVGSTTATSATIDTTATAVTYTLTIEDEMDLSTLGLEWTVNGAATKLKLTDLAFECVDLIGASSNSSLKRGTAIADNTSVAFWTTDDGDVDFTVDKWWNFPEFGRGYINVSFDAQYINEATDAYTAYIIMKHNNEDPASTVRMKYRHGVSGFERYANITADWAEYTINTGGFWNAGGNAPWGGYSASAVASRNSFFLTTNSGTANIDIRGIKIVKNAGTPDETVVYAWGDYNGNYAMPSTSGAPSATLNDMSALTLTPDADGSTFTYNAASKNITLPRGTYVVSGNFAAESGTQTVQLSASAANGTVAIGEEFTVSEAYTPVTVEIEVEEATTLADISVILGADVAVFAKDLTIAQKGEKFTAPNVGIMMALLLKKRATPKFEYTNLIPHVLTDAATSYWAMPGNCTLTVKETEDGKQYLAFENINKNYDSFAYTPGVTLDAGNTYQISGMMRTSVKGQNSQNRVWLGDTKLGSVKIDNTWKAFSYTVTVENTCELVLKFNGDAAEVFNKAYDVINLKVINLNEDPSYVAPEPGEQEEEQKPEVKKEYVDNGNEEVVLKAIEGSLAPDVFNDVGTDKWAISDQELTVKSQGGNLYLAMRNITVNHLGFTYKTGVTLEPGTYFFSADLRAAVKGQSTMLRAIINNQTVVGNVWFNNEWSAISGQFTVNAPTELTIKFFGGPDGSFIHDYDVSNILVTNIG